MDRKPRTGKTMAEGTEPPNGSDWRFKLQMEQSLQAADLASIKSDVAGLVQSVHSQSAQFSASMESLRESLNARGKTPWMILIGGAGVLLTLMSGLLTVAWFTINQNVQLSLSPISANIVRMAENQHAHDDQIGHIMAAIDDEQKTSLQSSLADVQSKTDRAQLNDRVHTVESRQSEYLADRKAEVAALAERAAEVETQFRAEDRIRNVQFAEQQRWNAILWNRLFPNSPYPSTAYFPEMAQQVPPPVIK